MQIGMIGLGRMGNNMVQRLMKGGHSAVVFDARAESIAAQHVSEAIQYRRLGTRG